MQKKGSKKKDFKQKNLSKIKVKQARKKIKLDPKYLQDHLPQQKCTIAPKFGLETTEIEVRKKDKEIRNGKINQR